MKTPSKASVTGWRRLLVQGQKLARVALVACVLAIAFLAFAPLPEQPGFDWDKTNHLVAFFTLAALAGMGWPGRAAMSWRLGLVLGYGAVIELVQAVLPYRNGSVLDFAADALGVVLYVTLAGLATRLRWRLGGGALPSAGSAPQQQPGQEQGKAGR